MPSSKFDSLQTLKVISQSKSIQEKAKQDRHRDCIVLILAYLRSCGYILSATQLQNEAGSTILSRYEVADNMDLYCLLRDYEDYFGMKFGRKPKFTRKLHDSIDDNKKIEKKSKNAVGIRQKISQKRLLPNIKNNHQKNVVDVEKKTLSIMEPILNQIDTMSLQKKENDKIENNLIIKPVKSCGSEKSHSICDINSQAKSSMLEKGVSGHKLYNEIECNNMSYKEENEEACLEDVVFKPLPSFGGDMELKNLAYILQRDILQTSPQVTWSDIVDLDGE